MSISVRCTGCRSLLGLGDELGGKKVRCPKCKTVLHVPRRNQVLVETAAEDEPPRPRIPTGRTGRLQREEPYAARKQNVKVDLDKEPPLTPPKKKGGAGAAKYKPCPNCGSEGATRVKWTSWGSFYGPRLLTHVQCPECAYCYNGKTGRSNALWATIFVMLPLLGIVGILGSLAYLLIKRGYLSF